MRKDIERKGVMVCDICGTDKNIYNNCCVCNRDICFNCNKKEMFMPTASVCRNCFDNNPKLQEIREKYIQKHYALARKEAAEMKKNGQKGELIR